MIDLLKNEIINLGRKGENEATTIQFNLAPFIEQYGAGSAVVIFQGSASSDPTIVVTTQNNGVLSWVVKATHTQYAGYGRCEVRWYVGDVLAKSVTFNTYVANSIGATSPAPTDLPDWLDELADLVDDVQEAVEDAQAAVNDVSAMKTAVSTMKSATEDAKDAAVSAKTSAMNAAVTAQTDAQAAQNAKVAAAGYASTASDAKDAVLSAKASIDTSVSTASGAATTAEQQKNLAVSAATNAQNSATSAASSKDEAQQIVNNAKIDINDAKTAAVSAANTAIDEKKVAVIAEINSDEVVGRIDDLETADSIIKSDLSALDDRLENLELASKGVLYKVEEDDDTGYKKSIPANTLPNGGKLDMFGGRSVVWNQCWGKNTFAETGVTCTKEGNVYHVVKSEIANNGLASYYSPIDDHYYYLSASARSDDLTKIVLSLGTALTIENVSSNWTKKSSIIKKTSSSGNRAVIYYYSSDGTTGSYDCTIPLVIDLTQMFGSGNEPTSVDDERIKFIEAYAEAHPEYNEGQIKHGFTESVEVQGKNLLERTPRYGNDVVAFAECQFLPKGSYIFSFTNVSATNWRYLIHGYEVDGSNGLLDLITCSLADFRDTGRSIWLSTTNTTISSTTIVMKRDGYIAIDLAYGTNMSIDAVTDFMLEEGSTATEFQPYHEPTTHSVPASIKALDGYGWSAGSGSVYNEVDLVGKRFIKRVGYMEVDDSSYSHKYADYYYLNIPSNAQIPATGDKAKAISSNGIIYNYSYLGDNFFFSGNSSGMYVILGKALADKFSTADDLKTYLASNPFNIIYELAEPVITDITDLIPSNWESLTDLEAGGSIEFKQTDTMLPIPNKETYVIKL